jgi:hypothetical protein
MRREAAGSADLHLFQELPTLDQQLTRTLLLRPRFGRIKPMFPARMPRPPFGGAVRYSHRRACGIFRLALPGPDTTRRTLFENRRTCWLRFGHGNVAQWPILRALRIVHLPLK